MEKNMEEEFIIIAAELPSMANGTKTGNMVLVFFATPMLRDMKETG